MLKRVEIQVSIDKDIKLNNENSCYYINKYCAVCAPNV